MAPGTGGPYYLKMANSNLPEDVTLADVVPTLLKPVDYVRRAFNNMYAVGGDRAKLVLRIGCMGDGKAPNYRIDRCEKGFSFDEGEAPPAYTLVADYHGRSHARLIAGSEPEDTLREEHWSNASMTFPEMQALIREVTAGGHNA